jgi:hypothetical protein
MKNPEYAFLENRMLSVLLYGKGFCMDYGRYGFIIAWHGNGS